MIQFFLNNVSFENVKSNDGHISIKSRTLMTTTEAVVNLPLMTEITVQIY